MKRFIVYALCFASLFALFGCSKKENIDHPVTMYYCNEKVVYNSSEAVISQEVQSCPDYEDDPQVLLQLYLKGPSAKDKFCPIPAEAAVVSASMEESAMKVVFSKPFAQLSGKDLTVACVCVAKTLMANYPVTTVEISALDLLLDGQFFISISENDFLTMDDTMITEE